MHDCELYERILGLFSPWFVEEVKLDLPKSEVLIRVGLRGPIILACPECQTPMPGYDSRRRRWRHLDTCQLQTILEADVPRGACPTHGVHQIGVPWAEDRSRFTALFERVAIAWLKEAGQIAVARRMGLTWDEVHGIMVRAVERGLARRKPEIVPHVGGDETSFQKRHEYVTVVCDLEKARVLHVADERTREALDAIYETLTPEQKAKRFFADWYGWAMRSRLEPMKKVARMLKSHLANVITYIEHRIASAVGEGLNAKIQWIKYTARGFRNRVNFRIAILFHCGGLDPYPHETL